MAAHKISMLAKIQIRDFGDFALNIFSIGGVGSIDGNYQLITSVVPALLRGD